MGRIKICERLNNDKRSELILNMDQCKHYPSSPTAFDSMVFRLVSQLNAKNDNGNSLVIGFAETATALGCSVAVHLHSDFITTTREVFSGDFLYFSEEHSHAPEQKILKIPFENYDHIIIVDDEITTGKTISNLISVISEKFPGIKFSVLTLVIGNEICLPDGVSVYYMIERDKICMDSEKPLHIKYISRTIKNFRKLVDAREYENALLDIAYSLDTYRNEDILVLGTEECMYPAIIVGSVFEGHRNKVSCHATTRSPIKTPCDPLFTSNTLRSCYDPNRITYIYNLRKYDRVIIVTDCELSSAGLRELVDLLCEYGNDDITCIILKESEEYNI